MLPSVAYFTNFYQAQASSSQPFSSAFKNPSLYHKPLKTYKHKHKKWRHSCRHFQNTFPKNIPENAKTKKNTKTQEP
jgi:hypothetical protein